MTIKTKLAGLAIAAAAVAGVATGAQAATYNNFNGTTGTYGNDNVTPAGTFANTFTFTLTRPGNATATITSSASSTATNINFTRVRLTGANGFSQDFAPQSTGAFEFRTFSQSQLAAGTYTLDVRGTTGGAASYTGDFSAAAVPEPATWGMMILGLGAAGTSLRRRRTSAKVRFA